MALGIVSNCWKCQLDDGTPLEVLIAEARSRGFSVIELRQTCLGTYESAETFVPKPEALRRLITPFPELRFNIALSVPFMSASFDVNDELISAGIRAAEAVAGSNAVHLRLVDVKTLDCDDVQRIEKSAVSDVRLLAERLAEFGGLLSLENSRQPWNVFFAFVGQVKQQLNHLRSSLRVCFDPCNLVSGLPHPAVQKFPTDLRADDLSMVHLKQTLSREPRMTFCEGDVDWKMYLESLLQIHFRGPKLFEIAPSAEIWDNLTRSTEYLRRLSDF